jgi:SulP family sulfate permease
MSTRLVPEFFSCIKDGCDRKNLGREVMAGVLVGIVALPLAIAFAIASGVKPEQGIFTAIIAGFLISFLSGSRVQIGGPTGAFIVVVFGIVAKFGYDGLAMATLMAGVFLVGMGLARMGAVIKFIPYPMTIGFTSGIALIIATTQIKDFFGLTIPAISGEFVHKIRDYAYHADTLNVSALLVGAISLLIIVFWGRLTKKVPGSIIAILGVHTYYLAERMSDL